MKNKLVRGLVLLIIVVSTASFSACNLQTVPNPYQNNNNGHEKPVLSNYNLINSILSEKLSEKASEIPYIKNQGGIENIDILGISNIGKDLYCEIRYNLANDKNTIYQEEIKISNIIDERYENASMLAEILNNKKEEIVSSTNSFTLSTVYNPSNLYLKIIESGALNGNSLLDERDRFFDSYLNSGWEIVDVISERMDPIIFNEDWSWEEFNVYEVQVSALIKIAKGTRFSYFTHTVKLYVNAESEEQVEEKILQGDKNDFIFSTRDSSNTIKHSTFLIYHELQKSLLNN